MNLYIYTGYNNYYNRQLKRELTLDEYEDKSTGVYRLMNTNFVPNDYVNTIHVFGSNVSDYDGKGDYLIAQDERTGEIDSRWFIIDSVRDRAGQHTLTLRRDLFADMYDEFTNSSMFLEKGTIKDISSPFLMNQEQFTTNQIKTNEYPLYDKSGCSWIIGYYSKNLKEGQTLSGSAYVNQNLNDQVYETLDSIEDWSYYSYANNNTKFVGYCNQPLVSITANLNNREGVRYYINTVTGKVTYLVDSGFKDLTLAYQSQYSPEKTTPLLEANVQYNGGQHKLKELVPTVSTFHTIQEVGNMTQYGGKILKDSSTNKYYKVTIKTNLPIDHQYRITQGSAIYIKMVDVSNKSNILFTSLVSPNTIDTFKVQGVATDYTIQLEEITQLQCNYDITGDSNRQQTIDQPYNIFAIPYGNVQVKQLDDTILINETNKEIALAVASAIQVDGQSIIQDIQVLPYFPMQELLTEDGVITVRDSHQYSMITTPVSETSSVRNVSIIFNIPYSRFTFNIPFTVETGQTPIDRKVNNQVDKWRLCSPSYASYFDFSVEMNGGLQYFNADCDYKPNIPYIHLNPNFQSLYGYDANDPRGLVLSGDFSLTRVNDAWESYQIQNKNFQNIFDRQIQNMEVQHKYQRISEGVGALTGTVSGIVGGAAAGSMIMPGIGAGIGAAVGGIASGIGGIADLAINEKLRNESLDYTKDMFSMQLENIQAIPQTISKVSALNQNNKLVPVLEYYTCTDEERKAFENKIKWNGMTLGIIIDQGEQEFSKYTGGYMKGQLIRVNDMIGGEDFHLLNSLSAEFNKGVYIE